MNNFKQSMGLSPICIFSIDNMSQYCLKHFEFFDFKIKFLNEYFRYASCYTCCDARQLELEGLLDFSVLLKYSGLNNILPFFILDISPTGTGKSQNHELQKELILTPMLDELDKKEENMAPMIKHMSKEEKGVALVHKGYHNGMNTSPQFFTRCAAQTPVQFIFIDEFGRALQRSNAIGIIDFLLENWGKSYITAPSEHKNYLHGNKQRITCSLFCHLNSTIAYLGVDRYINELKGGLLNRPLTYSSYGTLDKKVLEISDMDKYRIIENSKKIMEFARLHEGHQLLKNQIVEHEVTIRLKNLVKELKNSYDDDFADYFVRVEYNFKAILITLHYLREFDIYLEHPSHIPSDIIDDITYETAFLFILNYLNNFEHIVSILENKNMGKDNKLKKILNRILEYSKNGGLPKSFSDLGSRVYPKLKAEEARIMLNRYVLVNEKFQIIGLNHFGLREIDMNECFTQNNIV